MSSDDERNCRLSYSCAHCDQVIAVIDAMPTLIWENMLPDSRRSWVRETTRRQVKLLTEEIVAHTEAHHLVDGGTA